MKAKERAIAKEKAMRCSPEGEKLMRYSIFNIVHSSFSPLFLSLFMFVHVEANTWLPGASPRAVTDR